MALSRPAAMLVTLEHPSDAAFHKAPDEAPQIASPAYVTSSMSSFNLRVSMGLRST
jgi:hypothetical protein